MESGTVVWKEILKEESKVYDSVEWTAFLMAAYLVDMTDAVDTVVSLALKKASQLVEKLVVFLVA